MPESFSHSSMEMEPSISSGKRENWQTERNAACSILLEVIATHGEQHKENVAPLSCDEAKERMESDMVIPISDREQAIARYLVGQGMESWRAETEARDIIAVDPWTKEYVSLKLGHTWNQVHLAEAADVIAELRAEVERLRKFAQTVVDRAMFLELPPGLAIAIKSLGLELSLTEKQDG